MASLPVQPANITVGPAVALWLNGNLQSADAPVNAYKTLCDEVHDAGIPAVGALGVPAFPGDTEEVWNARSAAAISLRTRLDYASQQVLAQAHERTYSAVLRTILQAWAPAPVLAPGLDTVPAAAVYGASGATDAHSTCEGLVSFLKQNCTPFVVSLFPDDVAKRHHTLDAVIEKLLDLDAHRRAAVLAGTVRSQVTGDALMAALSSLNPSAASAEAANGLSQLSPRLSTAFAVMQTSFYRRAIDALLQAHPVLRPDTAGPLKATRGQALQEWWRAASRLEGVPPVNGIVLVLEEANGWNPAALETLARELQALCPAAARTDGALRVFVVFYNGKSKKTFEKAFLPSTRAAFSLRMVNPTATHSVALRVLDWLQLAGHTPLQLSSACVNLIRDDLNELDPQVQMVLDSVQAATVEHFSRLRGAQQGKGGSSSTGRSSGGGSSGFGPGGGNERARLSYLCAPLEFWALRFAHELGLGPRGGADLPYSLPVTSPLFSVCSRVAAWMPEADVRLALSLDSVQALLREVVQGHTLAGLPSSSSSSSSSAAGIRALSNSNATTTSARGGGIGSSSSTSAGSAAVPRPAGSTIRAVVDKYLTWLGWVPDPPRERAGGRSASAAAGSSEEAAPAAEPQHPEQEQPQAEDGGLAGTKRGASEGAGEPEAKRKRVLDQLKRWSHWRDDADDPSLLLREKWSGAYLDDSVVGIPQGMLPLARHSQGWPVNSSAYSSWVACTSETDPGKWDNPALPLGAELPLPRQLIAHALYRLVARRIGGLTAGAAVFALTGVPYLGPSGDVLTDLRNLLYDSVQKNPEGELKGIKVAAGVLQNAPTPAAIAAALTRAREVLVAGVSMESLTGLDETPELEAGGSSAAGAGAAASATNASSAASSGAGSSGARGRTDPRASRVWWAGAILPVRLFAQSISKLDAVLAQCAEAEAAGPEAAAGPTEEDLKKIFEGAQNRNQLKKQLHSSNKQGPLHSLRDAAVKWLSEFAKDWLCSPGVLALHEVVWVTTASRLRDALHPRPEDELMMAVLTPGAYLKCPVCDGGAGSSSAQPPAAAASKKSAKASSAAVAACDGLTPSLPDITIAARTLLHMPGQRVSIRDWFTAFRSVFQSALGQAEAKKAVSLHPGHSGGAGSALGLSSPQVEGIVECRFVSAYHQLWSHGFIRPYKRGADQVEKLLLGKKDDPVTAAAEGRAGAL